MPLMQVKEWVIWVVQVLSVNSASQVTKPVFTSTPELLIKSYPASQMISTWEPWPTVAVAETIAPLVGGVGNVHRFGVQDPVVIQMPSSLP